MTMMRAKPATKKTAHLVGAKAGVEVDKRTGILRSLVWNKQKVDLMKQTPMNISDYAGTLEVYDKADRTRYSDLATGVRVSKVTQRGQTLKLTKTYAGAPFALTETFRMEKDYLLWEVEAVKRNKKVSDRSLRVHFNLPLIAGWDIWAPCLTGERTFDGSTAFEHLYTQIPYVSEDEIVLPMFSHYNRLQDVGLSVVEPIDANVPAAKFAFNNANKCFAWGSMHTDVRDVPVLETVNYFIGLVGDRPMKTSIRIYFHEGGWRPGLGLVYRDYKPFFDPFNRSIYDREGVFECGVVHNSDHVDKMKAMGIKTFEVHGHFEDYCDYFQSGKDEWWTINAKESLRRRLLEESGGGTGARDADGRINFDRSDLLVNDYLATHSEEEVRAKLGPAYGGRDLKHRRADIHRRLKKLARAGISCHWYFNYTDGFRARVEKDWPDSISRDEDGVPIPSGWYMSHNMNADPRWSFGKFCYASAKKIFAEYETLDGFFLDCFRHYEIDFAHDDGVTVVNGKPCYSMNRSYNDIEKLIKTKVMKPQNLTSFANKPMSIRSMRYCDGQLLEGNGDMYEEKFFWASIAMPMFFMWTRQDRSLGFLLRRSVWHGSYPRNAAYTEANIRLYQQYLPLFKQFRERVFCFEPDPLRVPHGSKGKLYTVADGYVAGICNDHVDDGDKVTWGKRPYALFRVKRGHDITRVLVSYPGDKKPRRVEFKFDGTFIAVPLDGYKNCAVVKLVVGKRTRRRIGRDIFAQRARMCGDPDSAFEDVSAR